MAALEQQKPQGQAQGQPQSQEREVVGGVVFAKPRPKPPTKPNPIQAILQNKKLMLIIAGVIIGALVIFAVIKIVSSTKKRPKKPVAAEVTKEEKKAEVPQEAAAPKPEVPMPKEQAVQVVKEEAAVVTAEDLTKQAVVTPSEAITAYQPQPKKKPPKKITDTSALTKMLEEALQKGDESVISYAVRGIEENGDDAAGLLKDVLMANFNNPSIRINAILGLFYSSRHEAVAVVKTALKVDPDEDVRITALAVLDSLVGETGMSFMEAIAKDDPSERVRKKAQELLEFRSIGQ